MKIADHRRQPTAAVSRPRLTRMVTVMAAALLATPWSPVQAGATLYSFGAAAGDTALARCDDCSLATSWAGLGPAGSSLSLPFFRGSYTSSFVNNNGNLSFNAAIGVYTGQTFPFSTIPILAPFFADVDTRGALSGQVWTRTSQDTSLLATLAQDVKSAYGGASVNFNPSFAQIVTWDRVGYYSYAVDKLNSFQLALVSDGSHTYTLFKYPTGGIGDPIKNWDWGQVSPAGSFASVGFDAGDGVNFFNTPGSGTSSVRSLPDQSNTSPANLGTFVYRLDQSYLPATPGTANLAYALASHTWEPAVGSNSWLVNGTNWTALKVNNTAITRDSPTQWRNGDSAVFVGAPTVALGGTLVAQRVTVIHSGTTFAAAAAGTSLQLDSLEMPSAASVVNFAGNLVVITHAGDAGLKRASAGAPLLQQGALAQGKLVFTDTSVLAARDAGMVNGAEIVLNKSAQLQLFTAGATTRASVLSFDNTGGGTGGVLDLRGLSTTLGAVRSQGPSAGAGRISNSGSGSAAATLTVDFDTSSQTFSGVAQNGTGALALHKAGSGSWTLSGANTYTGGTTLAGGTLVLGSAGAIGSTGSISFAGGTLQHSAANTGDYSARFSTAANQLYSIDTGGQSVALATALGSSGGTLDKRGAGALQLSAASTYTGATTVTGGTLALLGSTQSPSFSVASGAALDLRTSVSTGTLDQVGSLLLGVNNLTITQDYRNANFGVGNAFNRRAGVTGTGQIRAAGTTQQVLVGTAVSGGTTATPTLALGNLRVGSTVTRTVQIQNVGSGGPSLRGALQTTGITSAALSGSGVTAQNWGALAQGATGPIFDVVYSPTQGGALTSQTVAVVNNFDNVAGQTLAITGAAYRPAAASTLAAPVQLAAQRVGATATQALTLGNTAVADSFSERLNASLSGTGAIVVSGSVSLLGAGATSDALRIRADTATAGFKNGTATVTLASDGTGTSGLSLLALGTQQVAVSGKVYAPAVAQAQTTLVDFGIVRVGDTVATRPVVVGNAATGALTDTLRATLGGAPAPFTAAGTASAVAAGQVDGSSLSVALDTGSAGVFSGAAQIGFRSQNPDMADLALAGAAVALRAQVNHLAAAELSLVSGAGSFSGSAGRYTLSFGTLVQGSAALTAQLALGNAAPQVGWSDALAGSFDLSGLLTGQMLAAAGFGSFSGLAAGTAFDTLVLSLDSSSLGNFSGVILLNARSTNADDPAGRALGPIELHLQGSVVAVPEPQTWLLMLGGLGLLLPTLLRRRSVVRRDSSRT